MSKYRRQEDRFSYLRTKDDIEIDLIIERSKKELWAIEIKSAKNVSLDRISTTIALVNDLKPDRFIIASREEKPRKVDHIEILPWQQVLQELY
jgi:predicted AAA+ superfamily ATPase